ncbi:hypothetical protein BGZ73_002055 [Actinomortierella ambigua]|nr:hypothetical protein BGZ73_002055 [Actinomortierella ambigua]
MAAATAKFNGYLHSSTNHREQSSSSSAVSSSSTATPNGPPTARAYAKRPPPVPTNDSFVLYQKLSNRSSSSSQHRALPATPSPSVSSISSFESEARPEPPPKDIGRRAAPPPPPANSQHSLNATHLPLLTLDTQKPAEPITSFAEAVEATMSRYRSGSTSSSATSISSQRARSNSNQSHHYDQHELPARSLGRSLTQTSVSSLSSHTSKTSATTGDNSSSSHYAHRSREHDQHSQQQQQQQQQSSYHSSQSSRSGQGSSGYGQHSSSTFKPSVTPPISPYYEDQPSFFPSHLSASNGYNSSQTSLHKQQQPQQNGYPYPRQSHQQQPYQQQQQSSSRTELPYRNESPMQGYGSHSTTSLNSYHTTGTSSPVPGRSGRGGLKKSALVKTPIARARAREAGPPRKVFWGDMMTIVTIERPDTPPPPPPPDKKKKKKKVKKSGNPTGVNQDPEYDSDYYRQPYTPAPAEVVVTLAPWINNPNFDEEQANSRYTYEDDYEDEDDYYEDDYYDDHGGGGMGHYDLRKGPDDYDYDDDDDDDDDEDDEEEEGGGSMVWGKGIGGGKGFQKKKSGGMFKFKRAVNRLLRN